jgi:hypothetical protein
MLEILLKLRVIGSTAALTAALANPANPANPLASKD